MAALKFLLCLAVAIACVVAEEERQKKDVVAAYPGAYGYGAYPYAAGYYGYGVQPYAAHAAYPYSAAYATHAYPYATATHAYPYATAAVPAATVSAAAVPAAAVPAAAYPAYSAYSSVYPKAYSAYPGAYSVAAKAYPAAYSGVYPYSYANGYQPAVVY